MTPEKKFRSIRKELILLGIFLAFAVLVVVVFLLQPPFLAHFLPKRLVTKGMTIPESAAVSPAVPAPIPTEAPVPPKAVPPRVQVEVVPESLLVDDFDLGSARGVFKERFNALGTYQGTFSKRPSYTVLSKTTTIRRGEKGRSLIIDYFTGGGWCGYYTLLAGIDISAFNTLSFWIKGEQGGEVFDIGLADQRMQELEIDAVYLGSVNHFLPQGVNTEWQEVKVPLGKVAADIDLTQMGSLVFFFRHEGKGRVYVEDILFKNDPEIERMLAENAPRAETDPLHPRSVWVWKTDPAQNLKARKELLELCERTGIKILYLFVGDFSEEDDLEYAKGLEGFLREAHQRGLKVEALTGNPIWQMEEQHETALNWVRSFLEFNKKRPPEARMDGISLDVEPYLAQEWNEDREGVKAGFLSLLRKVRALIEEYPEQEFRFGVVAPVFYAAEGPEFEREIFRNVDVVALMDYYDTAREILGNAKYHLDLAEEMGKKLAIGVETQDLVAIKQGGRRNTFFEEGWEGMEEVLKEVKKEVASTSAFEGFAIHYDISYKNLQKGRNVPTKERKILYTLTAAKAPVPPVIDGDLSDWKREEYLWVVTEKDNVVYGQGAWRGAGDLSFQTMLQWDEQNLYFAARITDDQHVQEKKGKDLWEGDHVEFWLDMDLEGDYLEAVNSDDDFQFGFSPGNFKSLPPEIYIWTPPLDPENLKLAEVACRKTEEGYVVEVRLPVSFLFTTSKRNQTERIFKLGDRYGVSIDMSDTDDARAPQKSLLSTSTNRIWGDPTTFGILELKE